MRFLTEFKRSAGESKLDLQIWAIREAGIPGNGVIIQRRVPPSGPKGFVRVVEE